MENIFESIAARTGGDIYIGVVGPVRTGKSTCIKRIMDQLVIPAIDDPYRAQRARDELPQSGSGRTIMTSEPKFVPEEAVEISPDGCTRLRVRMIDSVGYMVPGAVGDQEDGKPRMVATPWYDHEIPMTDAAELGTKKVMQEHCTIGLVVTTDGSVADIPRQDYLEAERRAIRDMQATGKPFLVVVNSRNPASEEVRQILRYLKDTFGVEAVASDCQSMDAEGILGLLKALLYAFPMQQLRVRLPRWVDALEPEHPVKAALWEALIRATEKITGLGTACDALEALRELEQVQDVHVRSVNPGLGTVVCVISLAEGLFYEILSQQTGMEISGDAQLLKLLTELSRVKTEYDKVSGALAAVQATGYGVVVPGIGEMKLEKPEIVKKGSAYGVKLRASAPAIHMLRVDIDTEISPMAGDEKQARDLIAYLGGEDPEKLWQSNLFGKPVHELIQEGMTAKLVRTPEDVKEKFRGTLSRIVNDGANGLICLIL